MSLQKYVCMRKYRFAMYLKKKQGVKKKLAGKCVINRDKKAKNTQLYPTKIQHCELVAIKMFHLKVKMLHHFHNIKPRSVLAGKCVIKSETGTVSKRVPVQC